MKKRLLSLFCAAGLAFSCAIAVLPEPVSVVAEETENTTVTEGPLTFILEKDYASLDFCNREYEGAVEIPAEINDIPVTRINKEALYKCSKVTSISIPTTVTEIGPNALNTPDVKRNQRHILGYPQWSELTEISVAADNRVYVSVDGVLFTKDMKILVQYPSHKFQSSYTVPDGVEWIGPYAMSGAPTVSVILPESMISIQDYAFWCADTTTINLPNNLKFIHEGAFANAQLVLSGSFTLPDNIAVIEEDAFGLQCPDTITILNPNCILDGNVFSDSGQMTYTGTIRGYDGSTAQEYAEKYGCTFESLGSAPQITHLPCGIIGDAVYWEMTTESTIRIYGRGKMYWLPSDTNGVTSIIIEKGVTNIPLSAFKDYTKLTSITIPDSVTFIGVEAFSNCSALTSITIPDSVTSIGMNAFSNCASLTSITIPDSVTSIGMNAFYNTPWLEAKREKNQLVIENNILIDGQTCTGDVTIPNNVTNIGSAAFLCCSDLTSITIPDSVTSIGNRAFAGCDALTSITIPGSVTSISDYAFSGCDALTSITIPDSVTSIGIAVFEDCDSLESITIPNSVTNIGNELFQFCSGLTSITIPDSVTSISDYAFSHCFALTSITIPDSVTSIGKHAFSDCWGLTSIILPDSVMSISDAAFSCCDALTSITIPDSVTSIGNEAFRHCSSLTSITIPDRVTSIGYSAFYECISLQSIMGTAGSYAETYANENNIPFEILENETTPEDSPIRGDVTADGVVSVDDAQLTLKAYTERIAGNDMKLTNKQTKAADVNNDGELSVDDAQNILIYYVNNTVAGKVLTWEELLGKA